jgi:DNA (cytosine-5)-methyltransferase 3A
MYVVDYLFMCFRRYLEMTEEYLKDEQDEWNPNRGTGILRIREAIDVQTSWTAFSHRCLP